MASIPDFANLSAIQYEQEFGQNCRFLSYLLAFLKNLFVVSNFVVMRIN